MRTYKFRQATIVRNIVLYVPHELPVIEGFEEYMARVGASNDEHIVLYNHSPSGFLFKVNDISYWIG